MPARFELAAAVTTIIGDMIDFGLVYETDDGPATGGRRPIMLELNPRRGYLMGVDLGASHYSLVVTDFAGRVLNEAEARLDIRMDPVAYLSKIDEATRRMLADVQLQYGRGPGNRHGRPRSHLERCRRRGRAPHYAGLG